jgi:hypothetical protein
VRKFATIILAALFTLNLAVAARAEDGDRGSVTALFGAKGSGMVNYHLGDKLDLSGGYEDYQYKAGFYYRPWEPIGFKAGVRTGEKERETAAYGGFDFLIPFGTNLKLAGFYDTGYKGPDWNRYEAAVRIQMYERVFLYAGIRGENGSGAPVYEYNDDGEALLFLRGDIGWKWNKLELRLQPTMHIQGDYFHNYELKYHFNDQTAALLNVNSEFDETVRVRMGFEHKF